MAFPANEVIEVKIGYVANGQQCYNVSHRVIDESGAGVSEVEWQEALASAIVTGAATPGKWLNEVLTLMSNDVSVNEVTVQGIWPTRYRISRVPVTGMTGSVDSPCNAQNVAAVFTKFGDLGERSNVGSYHQGGLPQEAYADGLIAGGYFAQLGDLADAWLEDIEVTLSGITLTFTPALLNKSLIVDSDPPRYEIVGSTVVTSVQAQDSLRVMRRRTVRVGI